MKMNTFVFRARPSLRNLHIHDLPDALGEGRDTSPPDRGRGKDTVMTRKTNYPGLFLEVRRRLVEPSKQFNVVTGCCVFRIR